MFLLSQRCAVITAGLFPSLESQLTSGGSSPQPVEVLMVPLFCAKVYLFVYNYLVLNPALYLILKQVIVTSKLRDCGKGFVYRVE